MASQMPEGTNTFDIITTAMSTETDGTFLVQVRYIP